MKNVNANLFIFYQVAGILFLLMKVLLINPPNSVPAKWDFPLNIFQPLGISYIAALLEKEGYDVKILDALALGWKNERIIDGIKYTGLTQKEIAEEVKNFGPDIVGIAFLFTFQAREGHNLAKTVKKLNPNIFVIAGGAHATTLPKEVLDDPMIDCAVIGEGEYTVKELIKKIENDNDWRDIQGIAYKNKRGEVVENPKRAPIGNLDELPFPARHLLPMETYQEAAKKVKSSRSISTFNKRWATIITSRGCPFNCVFCTIHLVMNKGWRARSPENVVAEIKELRDKYGVEHLDIEDDNFTLKKERTKEILDRIAEKKIKITWSTPNGIRADTVDEELIKKMKQSGCTRTIVAPESGNQEVVNNIIGKMIDLEKISQVVRWCKKYKLLVEAFFVLGFPGETKQQMRDTINYAKKLRGMGADDCAFYIATPFYGTRLYQILVEKGYLKENPDIDMLNTLSGEPLYETEDFTKKELLEIWEEAKKVNPPISRGRARLALAMFRADPLRAFSYAKEGLGRLVKTK